MRHRTARRSTRLAYRCVVALSWMVFASAGMAVRAAPPERSIPGAPERDVTERRAIDPRGVNPFTGNELALERKQMELERARLDEQIASAELNRRKFQLEMLRLGAIQELSALGALPTAAAPFVAAPAIPLPDPADVAARADKAGARRHVGTSTVSPGATRKVAGAANTPRATPAIALVAVVDTNGARHALVSGDGRIVRAAPGDMAFGHRVDTVEARSITLDGQVYALRDDVPTTGRGESRTHRSNVLQVMTRPELGEAWVADEAMPKPRGLAAGIEGAIPGATR